MNYAKIKISSLPDPAIANRRLAYNGYILINEKDVAGFHTGTFEDFVISLGGTLLTVHEAKVELSKNKYKWYSK